MRAVIYQFYARMFSVTEGVPIAIVCGGPEDKTVLRITEARDEPERPLTSDRYDEMVTEDDLLIGKYRTLPTRDRGALKHHVVAGHPPYGALTGLYEQMRQTMRERLKKEFKIEGGEMVVLPAPRPERVYVAGASGLGKSCWAAMYMREFSVMHPDSRIILITTHEQERAYSFVPHIELMANAELVAEPPTVEELANSLVVFDDCDNISDKKIRDGVRRINDDLISNGRKYGIYVLTLQHQLMNYKETRGLLNEAQRIVIFLSSTIYHTKRYLKQYVGLDGDQIKKITGLHSRWIMLNLLPPMYVVHQLGAFML